MSRGSVRTEKNRHNYEPNGFEQAARVWKSRLSMTPPALHLFDEELVKKAQRILNPLQVSARPYLVPIREIVRLRNIDITQAITKRYNLKQLRNDESLFCNR
jgi:hypothetical protein